LVVRGAFVRRHGLGLFQRAAAFEIASDARGAEGVIADTCLEPGKF
jgi:hypothetical protein